MIIIDNNIGNNNNQNIRQAQSAILEELRGQGYSNKVNNPMSALRIATNDIRQKNIFDTGLLNKAMVMLLIEFNKTNDINYIEKNYLGIYKDLNMEKDNVESSIVIKENVVLKQETDTKDISTIESPPPPPPQNAVAKVSISEDKLTASVYVSAPLYGGDDISYKLLENVIANNNVTYGIDKDILNEIIDKKIYNKKIVFAKGTPSKDGISGEIKRRFNLEDRTLNENEEGNIDFKNLKLIHNVKKGQVICDLKHPVPPVDGMNVKGNTVYGKKYPKLKIPKGKNTSLIANEHYLVSDINGNLTYNNGKYNVNDTVTVSENIDNSVGNIDFIGKLIIKGNVLEGFNATAEEITIYGNVEGCNISSNSNITIKGGVIGMDKAEISCKGNFYAKYIESSIIVSGGDISTQYIVNSTVSCNGELNVTEGRGLIVGGSYTVLKSIHARTIGNRSNQKTLIKVGISKDISEKRRTITKDIENVQKELDEVTKNIKYLERKNQMGQITQERLSLLTSVKSQKPFLIARKGMLDQKLKNVEETIEKSKESKVYCTDCIYSGVTLELGTNKKIISQIYEKTVFYLGDMEIKQAQL